ncbi:MAG: hypothetical protein EOP21_13690, partial [Hyphomicrobiales bacterium]
MTWMLETEEGSTLNGKTSTYIVDLAEYESSEQVSLDHVWHAAYFRKMESVMVEIPVKSPEIIIGDEVYRNTADFALRYMRQQR